MDKLKTQVIFQTAWFLTLLGAILFLTAWSLDYWQAWVYWFTLSAIVVIIDIYFFIKDPELIKRRLNLITKGEKRKKQKVIQFAAGISYLPIFIFPGLDHHFGWSNVPTFFVLTADIFVVIGFYIICIVFKENSYTSSVIEVDQMQKVITTGPYRLVRHPMYSGALLYLLSTPVALGSFWGLLFVLPLFVVIVFRLQDEEKFLIQNLPGYKEYYLLTRYRLIPRIW